MNHLPTAAECNDCHSTLAWTPANFSHATVTEACSVCHNDTFAEGKASSHFATTLECDSCHTSSGWSPLFFTHTGAYPGDHRQNLDCTDCHTSNAQTVPFPFPAYQPDCAACHANDYDQDEHDKAPGIQYTVSELRDCSGACHEYTNSSFTTIKDAKIGEHRVSDADFD